MISKPSPEPAPAAATLRRLWGEIRDLTSVEELLGWDQETYMPSGGTGGRALVASTIARIRHERLTSTELADALDQLTDQCANAASPDNDALLADVRLARREVDRACLVPLQLAGAMAEASSRGGQVWQEARDANDFSVFEQCLTEIFALKREMAQSLAGSGDSSSKGDRELYDELLDEYEPGLTCATLEPLFDEIEPRLHALVDAAVGSGVTIDEGVVLGSYPAEQQLKFGRWACEALGFDFARGRIDSSTHPFCLGLNRDDVRFTWRCDEADFRSGLLAIFHELGHGLYEQGLPVDAQRDPSGAFCSLGIHESQSRFWENQVGRSLGFWRGVLPRFRESFKNFSTTAEEMWPCLHTIRPSLIRVEADEVTYNLHVAIRFRLERALLSGDLTISDLPGAWNEAYRQKLGVEPKDLSTGVLQDIHWSQGLIGYFPTYTIGTLVSRQLYVAAEEDLGDLQASFEALEFQPILDWMRQKVHTKGARYSGEEIVKSATGKGLSAEPFLEEMERHAHEIYGVSKPRFR